MTDREKHIVMAVAETLWCTVQCRLMGSTHLRDEVMPDIRHSWDLNLQELLTDKGLKECMEIFDPNKVVNE